MRAPWWALLAAAAMAAACGQNAGDGGTTALARADCATPPRFTVGGQYVDPGNGVPTDRWSMLMRWQGDDMAAAAPGYDLGKHTTLRMDGADLVRGQRGRPAAGGRGPGTQVRCAEAGMYLSTWQTPHLPVLGGGYNDMYGFAWSPGRRPAAFVDGGRPGELVLEARLAVPTFATHRAAGLPPRPEPGFVLSLFAYLRDRDHPDLGPLAVLAVTHASRDWPELLGFDYCTGPGECGVWFAAAQVTSTGASPFLTVRATEAGFAVVAPGGAGTGMRQYRAHLTAANLRAVVAAVEAFDCGAAPCPARGYSADPADWVVEYAGVIAESYLAPVPANHDEGPSAWVPDDPAKDQVEVGVRIADLAVRRVRPSPSRGQPVATGRTSAASGLPRGSVTGSNSTAVPTGMVREPSAMAVQWKNSLLPSAASMWPHPLWSSYSATVPRIVTSASVDDLGQR